MNTIRIFMVVTVVVMVAGCGKSEPVVPGTPAAARVNGDEIAVLVVNKVMAQGGADAANSQQVLERLVDQQLLVQKAVQAELERDPAIMADIEQSRRMILAQAYNERTTANVTRPGPEEISRFYAENPLLFSQRRIYRFQELVATVNAGQKQALQQQLEKTRNLNDLAGWMKQHQIVFNGNYALRAAEQLPLDQLPRFQNMKVGEIATTEAPNQLFLAQLIAVQSAPLAESQAAPMIADYLLVKRRKDFMASELAKLRSAGKIEYLGAFAKSGATAVMPTAAAEKP